MGDEQQQGDGDGMVNQQCNDEGLRELELFAGAGGGILSSILLGHRVVAAVEYNAYARSILLARQNDGTFPPFPIWDDVRTFDGRPWAGIVDVVSGGFPCQDISIGGAGDGLDGERSGLWAEMLRIVREIRPEFVRIENSPMLTDRGLDRVLADLAALGFDAEWGVLSASGAGAPHQRERIWILAHARGEHEQGLIEGGIDQEKWARPLEGQIGPCNYGFGRWPSERGMVRVDDGLAHRADRLKAIGNGQVSRVAAAAWEILTP